MSWASRMNKLLATRGCFTSQVLSLRIEVAAMNRGSCNRYLVSPVSGRNLSTRVTPFTQATSLPFTHHRMFCSTNAKVELQASQGSPVHQGKLPFIDAFLYKMKKEPKLLTNKKIWSRRSMILPEFVNCNVRIHNGKNFVRRKITESMVGHKFGEFAFTRKRMKLKTAAVKKKAKKV